MDALSTWKFQKLQCQPPPLPPPPRCAVQSSDCPKGRCEWLMDNNCYAFVRTHYRASLAPETRQRIRQARGAALSSKQLVNSCLRAQEVVTFGPVWSVSRAMSTTSAPGSAAQYPEYTVYCLQEHLGRRATWLTRAHCSGPASVCGRSGGCCGGSAGSSIRGPA